MFDEFEDFLAAPRIGWLSLGSALFIVLTLFTSAAVWAGLRHPLVAIVAAIFTARRLYVDYRDNAGS